MKKLLTLFVFAISFIFLSAQSPVKGKFKRISADVYGGIPILFGDMESDPKSYNVGGRLNWNMTRSFSFGTEFTYGAISGQEKTDQEEYFTNKYMKITGGGEFYFFNLVRFNDLTKWFQPYVGVSLGAIKSNVTEAGSLEGIKTDLHNDWNFLHQYTLGTKFKLSNTFDLNARFNFAFLKTDDFDNENLAILANKNNDILGSADIGLTMHFGKKGKTPIIWAPSDDFNLAEDSLFKKTKDQLDDLEEKVEEVEEVVEENQADTEQDVTSLQMHNDELQKEVDGLKKEVDGLKKSGFGAGKGANESNSPNGYQIGDEYITAETVYTAELEGPSDGLFFIVSGSYHIIENALARAAQLSELGYTPIIMKEPAQKLNRVVIDSSDNFDEAVAKVKKHRRELDPEAWVIKNWIKKK